MAKHIVSSLYKKLSGGETQAAAALLASDLEWWFHGPPGRQYMMRVLTGADDARLCGFRFQPLQVVEAGKWVVAEGWGFEGADAADYWVHVWAVQGGVITQFREYFNTRVTIHEVGRARRDCRDPCVWESQEKPGRPLPGLVLIV